MPNSTDWIQTYFTSLNSAEPSERNPRGQGNERNIQGMKVILNHQVFIMMKLEKCPSLFILLDF